MNDEIDDAVEFDEAVAIALAELAAAGPPPRPELKGLVLSGLSELGPPPPGFAVRFADDADWKPHPVLGIRMKVLSINQRNGYATLLLDASPGTRFPAHHHAGDEECYVISGSLFTIGRRFGAGDFVHADGGTDHSELWTDEGAQVLLVVPPEDYMQP